MLVEKTMYLKYKFCESTLKMEFLIDTIRTGKIMDILCRWKYSVVLLHCTLFYPHFASSRHKKFFSVAADKGRISAT